jgi:antitoxin VapB
MSLNIKNEEALRLARELTELTGQSITVAVTEALRERVARLRDARDGSLAERLLAIGRDCAKRLTPDVLTVDHGELLYDERGCLGDR